MNWSNPVRQRLHDGQSVLGVTVTTPSIEIAARVADLGFDFLWIEMEHSPITLESLRSIVLATKAFPALPFARVPVNELWTAKRVLDAGVSGVIFPFTSTPALAQQAAASCRYPPAGRRGSGAGLPSFSWPGEPAYHDSADENVFVTAVVEEARALDSIDEIASTKGIDVIFIGTSDLSFSLGLRGVQDHPLMEESIKKIAGAAKRHGKFLGRPARSGEAIERHRAEGFQFFQGPTEIGLLTKGAAELLEPLGRSVTSRPYTRYLY